MIILMTECCITVIVKRCIIAIALDIARIVESHRATFFNLSQCIHFRIVRILMRKLRSRLLKNEFVDVLKLFAIFFRLWSSVNSVWALIPVPTCPISVIRTTHNFFPLLNSHHVISIPWLLIPVGLYCLLTQLIFENHLRLSVFDSLRNINIRLSHFVIYKLWLFIRLNY